MTSPNGQFPDGAFTLGGKYGQDITQTAALNMIGGGAGAIYQDATGQWIGVASEIAGTAADVTDGQLEYNQRLDLLEGVRGYCSTFMSKNWRLPRSTTVTLPFDTQLGPNLGASPSENGILFATRGLWRCDAHVSFYPAASGWGVGSGVLTAQVLIRVASTSSNSVYTERQYDIVITSAGAETAAFSTTFVIPNDNAYRVRAHVRMPNVDGNVYGGTLRSALSVNKWDGNTTNAVSLPVAPDGGQLT